MKYRRRKKSLHSFSTKNISGWLPIRDNRNPTSTSTQCPICQQTTDSVNHFITCSNLHWTEIWKNTALKLQKIGTSIEIRKAIRRILIGARANVRECEIIGQQFNKIFQWAYKCGPRALASGLIHAQLSTLNQELWLQNRRDTQPKETWAFQIITILIEHSHNLWEKRNEELFSQNPDNNITSTELYQKILYEYQHSKAMVHQNDKFIFRRSISSWQTAGNSIKKKWLITCAIAKEAFKMFLDSQDPLQSKITSYFNVM